MNKRKLIGICGRTTLLILMMLFVVIIVDTGINFHEGTEEVVRGNQSFNTGWSYIVDGESTEITDDLPTDLTVEKGESFVLRNIVPDIAEGNNTLKFRSSNQTVKVMIDGKLRYTFGIDEQRRFGKTPGSIWNFVDLSKQDSGKQITIELCSAYRDCARFVSDFEIGNKADMILDMIRDRTPGIVLSLFTILLGIYYVFNNFSFKKVWEIIDANQHLGLFGIFMGVWTLLDTGVIHLLYGHASILTMITFYCLMFVPITSTLYIYKVVLNKYFKTIAGLMFVCAMNIVIQTVLQLTNCLDLYEMVPVTHAIILGAAGIALVLACKEYIHERKREQKLFLAAVLIVTIASVAQMVVYYTVENVSYTSIIQIAMVIMILILGKVNSLKIAEMTEKSIKAEMFEKLAYEDLLTGIRNRNYFAREMKIVEENMEQYQSVAIVSFDMNDLKYLNDTFGHNVGDEMLCACAECLENAFSTNGRLARIGGDEYSVILTDVREEQLKEKIENLRRLTENVSDKLGHTLSVACGYAFYDRDVDRSLEAVLIRADKKMYENKAEMKQAERKTIR